MLLIITLAAALCVTSGALATSVVLLVRGARRLLQYDEVFQYISGDIQTNLKQFERISQSSVTGNDAEIVMAHKNMMVMAVRLNEILLRMEEVTGKRFRPKNLGPPPQFR